MYKIRHSFLSLTSLLLLVLLSACGAKGALYQPPKDLKPTDSVANPIRNTTKEQQE